MLENLNLLNYKSTVIYYIMFIIIVNIDNFEQLYCYLWIKTLFTKTFVKIKFNIFFNGYFKLSIRLINQKQDKI